MIIVSFALRRQLLKTSHGATYWRLNLSEEAEVVSFESWADENVIPTGSDLYLLQGQWDLFRTVNPDLVTELLYELGVEVNSLVCTGTGKDTMMVI